MANRGDLSREAIDASMSSDSKEESREGVLLSRYVHQSEGVPNDPKVVQAIDNWANVWGEEIVMTMQHEGLFDENEPGHAEAMEKLEAAKEALMEVLPSARFMSDFVSFDGGRVDLSNG